MNEFDKLAQKHAQATMDKIAMAHKLKVKGEKKASRTVKKRVVKKEA